ncbi:STAS domain-containing protein [Nonomuraea rhizosphaerae]|uniref:STAS domain-containing protein n=1 Tax=Nonomuraea rhizosphaerae TaxID=2665663 RepID=UPI001C5FA0DA|nr:STAS domain-containing protein [Nonomuraea rhizosphaerae]
MSSEATGKSTFDVTSGLAGNAIVSRLNGDLDAFAVPMFREHMGRIWELPVKPFLVLDLQEITFCDSMGMSELLVVLQRCEARGTRLMLGGVQGVMARVLSITGLRHAFEVYADFDDALRQTAT